MKISTTIIILLSVVMFLLILGEYYNYKANKDEHINFSKDMRPNINSDASLNYEEGL